MSSPHISDIVDYLSDEFRASREDNIDDAFCHMLYLSVRALVCTPWISQTTPCDLTLSDIKPPVRQ